MQTRKIEKNHTNNFTHGSFATDTRPSASPLLVYINNL
jgi:hypothetical protein